MPDKPHEPTDTANDGLPVSLCRQCVWGLCQTRVRRLDVEELEHRATGSTATSLAYEASWCNHPKVVGRSADNESVEITDPVTECDGYSAPAWAAKAVREDRKRRAAKLKGKPATKAKRARGPRGRKRR